MTRRLLLAVLAAAAVLIGWASPAAAHGGPGGNAAPAANYRTRIQSVAPAVPGLVVRVIDAGSRIELLNRTGETVTVLGYQDEPYLRIGPDGVFTNLRSPATYLNADRDATTDIPDDADPQGPPRWQRIDDDSAARFHDHRAHWMGGDDPPAVTANPSAVQVIDPSWEIPLLVGDQRVMITGDLTWIPGPSPWPWYIAAAAGVAGITAMLRWRGRAPLVLAVAMVGLLAAAVVDVLGVWWATAEPALAKLGELAAPVLCATVGIAGLTQLRRHRQEALALVGASAAGFTVLFGIANLDWLRRSQLPTGIDPSLARASVTAAVGLGGGTTAHAALGLLRARGQQPAKRPAPASPALPASSARRRIVLAGAGVAAVVVAATAVFGEAPGTPAPSAAVSSAPGQVHDRLCAALTDANGGDLDAARATFQNRVHGPLHDIAAAAAETDRAAAARLLEAKQQVEAALATNADSLAADMAALAPTVRAALVATGQPESPACPTESSDTPESEP